MWHMPRGQDPPTKDASEQDRYVLDIIALALPALLSLVLYAPSVNYSEWYIDELFAVLRNPDARGETPLQTVFSNDFWGNALRGGKGSWTHKSYRPLAVLSFALQFRLLGEGVFRPQPLRAFNVVLHAANAVLLGALLRRGMRFGRRWSCLAACLFAAQPVHVENVVYLVGRADALATTGWLLATVAQVHVRNSRSQGAMPRPLASMLLIVLLVMLAVISGLCKESGFTLLVFAAGLELTSPQAAPKRGYGLAVALLASFAAVAVARMWVTQGTQAAFGYVDTPVQYHSDKAVRTWTYLFHHAFYGRLLLLPGPLSWDYSFDALPLLRATWRDARSMAISTAYLGFTALSAWALRGPGSRRTLLGLLFVAVPFVPASNLFFTVGVTVGERLLYPSTAGAALAAAALGERLERRQGRKLRFGWPTAAGAALLVFYVRACAVRVGQWRSSEALYAADAASWPNSVKTRHQLGTVYHAQSRYDEALYHYNESLKILDDNALTDHCIAQIFIETSRYQEAVARFEKILAGHGVGFSRFNLYMLYVDYGFTLVALRRFDEAVPYLEQGLKLNEAVPHGLNALGFAHTSLAQLQEAQTAFAKGLEYDPENAVIWNNIAAVWMVGGALQQAAKGLEKALMLEPDNEIAVHNALLLKRAAAAGGQLDTRPKLELFFSRAI